MTKTIEDALNLPPMEREEKSLTLPSGLSVEEQHDKEMDEIIETALSAHKSTLDFGFNVEAKDAGKIFATSAQHLDIALKASKSKAEMRGKFIALKMNQPLPPDEEEEQPSGRAMTREELFRKFEEAKKQLGHDKDS